MDEHNDLEIKNVMERICHTPWQDDGLGGQQRVLQTQDSVYLLVYQRLLSKLQDRGIFESGSAGVANKASWEPTANKLYSVNSLNQVMNADLLRLWLNVSGRRDVFARVK